MPANPVPDGKHRQNEPAGTAELMKPVHILLSFTPLRDRTKGEGS